MITLELIQKLDQKVLSAVELIGTLRAENASLIEKLDTYHSRIEELEESIERVKQDGGELEKGIRMCMQYLDRLNDSEGEEDRNEQTIPTPRENSVPEQEQPPKEAQDSEGSELDIF